jgi:two-component system, NarL family, invasion response regulator UvrY
MANLVLLEKQSLLRESLALLLQCAGHVMVAHADSVEGLPPAAGTLPGEIWLAGVGRRDTAAGACRELKPVRPGRAVVLMLEGSDRKDAAEAIRLGASGLVFKHEGASELLRAIEAAVQAGPPYLSPAADSLLDDTSRRPDTAALSVLSARERQVIALVVAGLTSVEVGARLGLSPKTVDTYRCRLMAKLGVTRLAGLVRLAAREGLIDEGLSLSPH